MAPPPKIVSVSVDTINNINNNNNNNGHRGLTSPIVATSHTCSRRYAEIFAAAAKKRGDALVEPAPYMLGVGGRLRAFEPGGGVVKEGSAHQTGGGVVKEGSAPPTTPNTPNNNNNSNNVELIVDLVGSESVHELRLQRQQFRQPTAPLAHSQCSVETSSGSNSSSSSVTGERRGRVLEEEEGVGRGGGSSCEEEEDEVDGEEEEEEDEEETPCDIGLLERLIRSHPIWFLLGIQRAGAFHLLQGKEDGNFVVRQSSQTCTMAISVRLPVGKGPYIEHYLIEATNDGRFSLESSDNKFESIPALVAHYAQCCDELPVQLTLPRAVREAKNRQQLSSLALLGQEFWRYPMANPRRGHEQQQLGGGGGGGGDSCTDSQASSLSSFDSGCNNNNNSPLLDNSRHRRAGELRNDSIILNLSPLSPTNGGGDSQPTSLMSTFKGSPVACEESRVGFSSLQSDSSLASSGMVIATETCTVPSRAPRPTPPNTLNLVCVNSDPSNSVSTTIAAARSNMAATQLVVVSSSGGSGGKTPPPPPPRWAKPALSGQQQNFTVTTTVTFSMNQETTPPPHVEVSCVQVTPNITSPDDRSLQSSNDTPEPSEHSAVVAATTESQESLHTAAAVVACHRRQQIALRSPVSTQNSAAAILSPVSDSGRQVSHRRSKRSKQQRSQHYQESDILESPDIYCRSSVADKVSDYEDIWEGRSTFKHPHQPLLPTSPFSSPDEASLSSGANLAGCKGGPVPDILERVAPLPNSTTAANTNRNRLKLSLNTAANTPGCASEPHTPEQAPANTPSLTSAHKQGSPFYAEPADAIRAAALLQVQRRGGRVGQPTSKSHRHSDPAAFIQWPGLPTTEGSCLERIDSKEELNISAATTTTTGLSSSVDNLVTARHHVPPIAPSGGTKLTRAKPVRPPKVGGVPSRPGAKIFSDTSWAVDSSWEFIGNEDDSGSGTEDAAADESFSLEQKFPSLEQQAEDSESGSGVNSGVKPVTVMQIISQRLPELCLSPEISLQPKIGDQNEQVREPSDCSRVSAYDNVSNLNNNNNINNNFNKRLQNGSSIHSQISDNDDAQTIFSEPWDSSRWEHLLQAKREESQTVQTPTKAEERKDVFMSRTKTAKERLDPLLSPPRLQMLQKSRDSGGAGAAAIGAYTMQLAADKSTTFAQNIDRFIACTRESPETSPQVVMRNMRQFMSGMKNYLVKHGERQFEKQVEKERNKLKANEFLNLDAILEGVMHKLVVRPLKEHLYKLFVDEFTHNGSIQLLADSIQYARTRPLHELGIRPKIVLPSDEDLITICHYLQRLQEVYSPLEKLEHLLAAISAIFESVKGSQAGGCGVVALGADDLLPLLVWVLARCGWLAAEVEADYVWGLLHSSLLTGEGAYYLTTLSSAVNVLKTMRADAAAASDHGPALSWGVGCPLSECRSVLKIVVPDEMNGSIITKTLPVRPHMTTRDVCKIIAHKVRITNPQDYGLYKLVDGEETLLGDGECPQDVKGLVADVGKHCMFAYKRIDAKIAWPRTTSPQ
ncbi:hypothetical protein LSTR_LSTR013728 [Laodelphax striatellus]|uniref:Protein sprint n=1 Tax=Laodelphax striatellus TaxID=195883 RepID=A0A482WWG2_LAOST|nr:hypothetical protein LSTR_LSTR013728 [Laodelphax striatellus]